MRPTDVKRSTLSSWLPDSRCRRAANEIDARQTWNGSSTAARFRRARSGKCRRSRSSALSTGWLSTVRTWATSARDRGDGHPGSARARAIHDHRRRRRGGTGGRPRTLRRKSMAKGSVENVLTVLRRFGFQPHRFRSAHQLSGRHADRRSFGRHRDGDRHRFGHHGQSRSTTSWR